MGRVLSRALEAAGLADLQTRVLSGTPLDARELARLQDADLLLVAGLADRMRAYFRGDEVRVLKKGQTREAGLVEFSKAPSPDGETGADLLRELSLLRLSTPPVPRLWQLAQLIVSSADNFVSWNRRVPSATRAGLSSCEVGRGCVNARLID